MKSEATVFVVDNDLSVRRALERLFHSVELDVQTHASAQEFLGQYDPARPGCLVLDVRMPGLSGLDLQDELAARNITTPIIFITGYGDVPTSVRAFKAGAHDFIEKPFSDQTLLDSVYKAIDRDIRMKREGIARAEVLGRVERLTAREGEVLALVVAGKLNKQIAGQLGVSEKTIKVHRARVMEKMQAASLPELVLLAQAAGVCTAKVQSE